ncbi:HD domain-containing protein [Mesobacillus foraminis]
MRMNEILRTTEAFVREHFDKEGTGHDWHHIDRVRRNALLILEKEGTGNRFVVEMAALLHDVPDEKLNKTEEAGWKKLEDFINKLGLTESTVQHIVDCIESVSFKGGRVIQLNSLEAKIVQDADRLDALGAIGIARTFAFGGKKGQPLFDPEIVVRDKMTLTQYRTEKSSSIHHFYEKLLKIKDLLNTEAARQIAEQRHEFMSAFLEQFYREWNGQA